MTQKNNEEDSFEEQLEEELEKALEEENTEDKNKKDNNGFSIPWKLVIPAVVLIAAVIYFKKQGSTEEKRTETEETVSSLPEVERLQ